MKSVSCGRSMKLFSSLVRLLFISLTSGVAPASLLDDKSLAGWEGEIEKAWRARDGVIVGGSKFRKK